MVKLKVEEAHGDYDYGTSKFLGAPTMPESWLSDGTLSDDDFFFCQIKLSELREHTSCTLLPPKGFLYIFLTIKEDGTFKPNVRLCEEEPDTLIDDFNYGFDFLGDTDKEYSIDFSGVSAGTETALFVEENESYILLQYDPLDDNMPEFLQETEKQAVFRIPKVDLENLDFSRVTFELN
ncbi:MAG: hypothetical protein E7522_11020 [Ruminococcaceae bacterium]|nr:hypothetical protein [Oscillospiraceae bacterium]